MKGDRWHSMVSWNSVLLVAVLALAAVCSCVLSQEDSEQSQPRGSIALDNRHPVVWAPPTNGYQMGVQVIELPSGIGAFEGDAGRGGLQIYPVIMGTAPTGMVVALPPVEQMAAVAMTGPDGDELPKTRKGKRFGRPIELGGKSPFYQGFRREVVVSEVPEIPGGDLAIRLVDLFRLPEPGDYKVIVELRAVSMVSNQWVISTFLVPPVAVSLDERMLKD